MAHPFATLTPDLVLDAVESIGFLSDARILALNSYENRVYQVGIEDSEPLIAKFYRPQRWTNEAILEEHQFTFELAECDVPVVAPMIHNGASLHEHNGFRFTLFPVVGAERRSPAISISCIAWGNCSVVCTPSALQNRSNTAKRWA